MELSDVMVHLSLRELADRIDGHLSLGSLPPLGGEWAPLGPIACDSRRVRPGDVFWGLPGAHVDGSDFAEDAFLRGAFGAVVAGRYVEPWAGGFTIRVDDAYEAMLRLGTSCRGDFLGSVIAIYGHGVTGVGGAVQRVLSGARRAASQSCAGSDELQLALAIASWEADADCAVVGIEGANDAKIQPISHLCCPTIAAIYFPCNTNQITDDNSVSQVLSVDRWLREVPCDSLAVLPGDVPGLRDARLTLPRETVWVGEGSECDLIVRRVGVERDRLVVRCDGEDLRIAVSETADWSQTCIALAVGRVLGLSVGEMQAALRPASGKRTRNTTRVQNEPLEVPSSTLALREVDVTLPPGLKQFAH